MEVVAAPVADDDVEPPLVADDVEPAPAADDGIGPNPNAAALPDVAGPSSICPLPPNATASSEPARVMAAALPPSFVDHVSFEPRRASTTDPSVPASATNV